MKTTINNNSRVFQVITTVGKQAFCNIEQLNEVVKHLDTRAGYFKIYHFWNNKPQRASKKYLDDIMNGLQMRRSFDM